MTTTDPRPTTPDAKALPGVRLEQQEAACAALDIPPCPDWCTLPAGHEYSDVPADQDESATGWTFSRSHSWGNKTDDVSQDELNAGGVVRLGPASIFVYQEETFDIDAEQTRALARRVSADLLELADRLDLVKYPELAHFADKPAKQRSLAAALDSYDPAEREIRREALGMHIAADKRGAYAGKDWPGLKADERRAGTMRRRAAAKTQPDNAA